MAGIGDYVHYRQERYKKFGVGRSEMRGMTFQNAYDTARGELLNYINSSKNSIDTKTIEKHLNMAKGDIAYIANLMKTQGLTDQDMGSLESLLVELINQHFGSKAANIDFSNLNILNQQLFERVKMYYSNKSNYFSPGTWQKFITQFTTALSQFNNAKKSGIVSAQEILQIDMQLQNMQKKMQLMSSQIQANSSIQTYKALGKDMKNLFAEYNSLIAQYSVPPQKDLGDLAEFIALYAAIKAGNYSETKARELLKESFSNPAGAQRSQTKYDFAGLIDTEELALSGFKIEKHEEGRDFFAFVAGSQDTVDVKVSVMPNKDLNLSVKNVNSKYSSHGVHVLSGAPLTAIFNLVNTDFVNHYMNIVSFYSKNQSFKSQYKKGNEIIKLGAAVRALSGVRGTTNPSVANMLVINERNGGKGFSVYSIQSLLSSIAKLGKNFDAYVDISGDNFPPKVVTKYEGTMNIKSYELAGKRITKLFSELHRIKLFASLKPAIFKTLP